MKKLLDREEGLFQQTPKAAWLVVALCTARFVLGIVYFVQHEPEQQDFYDTTSVLFEVIPLGAISLFAVTRRAALLPLLVVCAGLELSAETYRLHALYSIFNRGVSMEILSFSGPEGSRRSRR